MAGLGRLLLPKESVNSILTNLAGRVTSQIGSARATVFADSSAAFEIAKHRGLPAEIVLRTSSPALLLKGGNDVEQLDAKLRPDIVAALNKASADLSMDIYEIFSNPGIGGDHHQGVAMGLVVFTALQIPILKAASLSDADYTDPVAVVCYTGGNAAFKATYGTPLPALLATNPNCITVEVEASSLPKVSEPRPPAASLRLRIGFAGFQTLAYRLLMQFSKVISLPGPRGSVLVLRENELVKEAALSLAMRGFTLHPLLEPKIDTPSQQDGSNAALIAQMAEMIERRLGELVERKPREALVRIFVDAISAQQARYHASLSVWRRRLDVIRRLRPRVVMSSILGTPETVALHRVLRERCIPLVTFQHGVTKEINAAESDIHIFQENTAADLAVVFCNEAKQVCIDNPLKCCEAVAVGLPQDYRKGSARARSVRYPPIWYIATALYLGNRGQLFQGVTDLEKARHEIAIIENVLNRLPHGVFYKPYPAFRYLDSDPVIEAARASRNIKVYEDRADLRYLIQSSRVLVTSRSFSTPSWCIMSGRPTIYIDIPEQAPLRAEARDAFAAGVFLFDAGMKDFHENLRSFLSQPLEDIERQYASKAEARGRLIERFISTGGKGAGKRAASAILSLVTHSAAEI